MEALSFILCLAFYLLVACPFSLAWHELGHASMILLLTKQKVTFQFGVRGAPREIHLGRLSLLLYLEPGALFFCRYHLEDRTSLSWRQDFWITIAGPLCSLIFTLLFGALWLASGGVDPWTGLAVINLINLLNSGIPQRDPVWQGAQAGIPNDGLQLLQLIQGAKERSL